MVIDDVQHGYYWLWRQVYQNKWYACCVSSITTDEAGASVIGLECLGRRTQRKMAMGTCFSEQMNVNEALAGGDLAKRGTTLAWE